MSSASMRTVYRRLLAIAAETGQHEVAVLATVAMRRYAELAARRAPVAAVAAESQPWSARV